MAWQPQTASDLQLPLFGGGDVRWDAHFVGLAVHDLSDAAAVAYQQGWLQGSDTLFERLVGEVGWCQHRRPMYDRFLDEPRLTAWFDAHQDWPHPALRTMSGDLGRHFGAELCTLGMNLYRDGRDSVAWHGDRVASHVPEPVIAIVSLGAPRPFLLRPKGGGPSRAFSLGWGDLLVMSGRCQQEWDHAVPKVARAAPRISLMFRQLTERAGLAPTPSPGLPSGPAIRRGQAPHQGS